MEQKTKASGARTLGPVPDLEHHLPAEWWRSLFNALYLKTDGDVVENDENTGREIDALLTATGLDPNDRVLDLCCGQGRHALELARRGMKKVVGIDRSRFLVSLARKRARALALEVKFREGDARKFSVPESSFDCCIVMGNSFGYFDREEDDLDVLAAVKRALRSRGTLVLDLMDGDWMRQNFERRSWEWIDENQFVCRERSLSSDQDRMISREVVVHAEKGVIADQFYAERLYSRGRIVKLLEDAGFSDIRFHGALEAVSTRNHDLGMMAHRNFITAVAPPKAAAKRRRDVPYPEVTVLLGDPRLPDGVKRNGVFNPEDLETVNRLKEALGELAGYRFHYVDNHNALLAELKQRSSSFVFNLCDEGYNNDALKELHVPALLEMFELPYSGAGPAALGFCYNKALVRAAAESFDIPVPLESYHDPDDQGATLPSIFPALIKPCLGDSSIGITQHALVSSIEEAVAYLNDLRALVPGRPILVQEFLSGAEFTVGLIGNPGQGYTVLPLLEVDYSRLDPTLPKILSYESKWCPDSPYWSDIAYRRAEIDDDRRRELVDWSIKLFERLGCRDYARMDFRADANGQLKLLEVNPNPGWCWDGKMNLMAGFAGMRYADMLKLVLEAAQNRVAGAEERSKEQTPVRQAVA
ncbi:MAG: methyltransferase domain-containing protein [Gammaproteobacteria bacterium]|nr:methyltransferase domain-containing protein [Gammaproteobacteria bacterium]